MTAEPNQCDDNVATLMAAWRSGGQSAAQTALDELVLQQAMTQIEYNVMLGRFRKALTASGLRSHAISVPSVDITT